MRMLIFMFAIIHLGSHTGFSQEPLSHSQSGEVLLFFGGML
jgi:hypothetical protein